MMSKLLGLAIGAAAVLFAGGVHASASSCSAVDFTSSSSIAALNTVLDSAKSQLPASLASQDLKVISNKTLAAQSLSALGYTFSVTPVLSTVSIAGIKNAVPRHVNATGNNRLDLGADVNGTLTANGTLSLVVTQTNRSWYQGCLTDPLHPSTCAPLTLVLDFTLGLVSPSLVANTTMDMVACPTNATDCSDVSVSDVIAGVLIGRAKATMARALRRVKDASVDSVSLAFASVSALKFTFRSAGQLVTAITQLLAKYSKDTLNHKGDNYSSSLAYMQYLEALQSLLTSLLNGIIQSDLKPGFASSCYDS